jgi:hypothetical protein
MRTYGEDDDEVMDWIAAGILYMCVVPANRQLYGLSQGSAILLTVVKGEYIGDFEFETVWTEYFRKKYR